MLERFDLDPKFGPAFGISRIDRYNRALYYNLNPPKALEPYLNHKNVYQSFPYL